MLAIHRSDLQDNAGRLSALEEWVTARIADSLQGTGQDSVSTYNRSRQHFDDVSMYSLTDGYIKHLVCQVLRAESTYHKLGSEHELHRNGGRPIILKNSGNPAIERGCMNVSQRELLWATSVTLEARAQSIMASGFFSLNISELQTHFEQAGYQAC